MEHPNGVNEVTDFGTARPIRCLHVINSLGRGGAEQALVNLLPELQALGVLNQVATLTGPMTLEPRLRQAGIPVHPLGLVRPWDPRGPLFLANLLRTCNYEIVQAHLSASMLASGLSRPLAPKPKRVAEHLNLFYDTPAAHRVRHRASKWLVAAVARRLIDAHVAVSDETARHYERHLGLRTVTVIPLSAPLGTEPAPAPIHVAADEAMTVITPARFVAEKGHRYLVDAMALLRSRRSPIRAVLVGDGPLARVVSRQVSALGLDETVSIRPAVPHDELIGMIKAADVLVLPSTQEGTPVAVLEAMSLGKPVIASAVGGLTELILEGKTGLLVPPASPEALANALEHLLRNADRRALFGVAARERFASRYTSKRIAENWLALYRRLLEP